MKKISGRSESDRSIIFFRLIGIISIIVMIYFYIKVYTFDILPVKYLMILYLTVGIVYLLLSIVQMSSKIKIKYKVITTIVFILLSGIFGLAINYMNETFDFIDTINKDILQKEAYYVMVSQDSKINKLKELDSKKIGVFVNNNDKNMEQVQKKLTKKIQYTSDEYGNLEEIIDDLEKNELDAILVNGSAKNIIQNDLEKDNLKVVYIIEIGTEKIDVAKKVDVTEKAFNVYIAGGDSYGKIDKVMNTDVNMIATIDPQKRKILLTSIPRDYYVKLPLQGENAYDKLTHAGYYGIDESISSVENLLDININYYVKVNFSTIVGIIDAIGGVDVYSDYAFTTHNDEETKYYKFTVGNNHLNGDTALAFARERKSFIDGDVQRVKNQQKVLTAIIKKATSSVAIVKNYTQILSSVSDNFSTNIDSKSISALIKMQIDDMRPWTIESQNLTGEDYYTTNTYTFPGTNLYVMKRNEKSVSEAIEKLKKFEE